MDTKRLVTDIHRATGIRLDESDPVLAAATINERLLDEAMLDLRKLINATCDKITAQNIQNEESAKKVAAKIITDASVWMGDRMRETAELVTKKIVDDMRAERQQSEKTTRRALKAAYVSGGACLVSAGIACGLLLGIA